MRGKEVYKDPELGNLNEKFIEIHDAVDRIVIERMELIQKASEDRELTEEEYDSLTIIQDVAFRAQDSLENTALLCAKLSVL